MNKGRWGTADIPPLGGKIALVTGANSGLGLEVTAALAGAGATVVMACRDQAKAGQALELLRQRQPHAQAKVMALDLADLGSVRAFARAFAGQYPCLDILCNNAGVMALPLRRTKDGFEMQMGVNHLGHFALTGLLLERLKAAPAPRVVAVASQAHRGTPGLDLEDFNWERRPYKTWDAYGKSKLANLLFMFELDRRLRKGGLKVTAAAAHPGYSATNIGYGGPAITGSALMRATMWLGNALLAQPAAMGVLPLLYAATAADVQGGDYIGPGGLAEMRGYPKKVQPRPQARDPETALRLWALSERLTGVAYL